MQSLLRIPLSCRALRLNRYCSRLYSIHMKPFSFDAIPNEPYRKNRLASEYTQRSIEGKKFINRLIKEINAYDFYYNKNGSKLNKQHSVMKNKDPGNLNRLYRTAESVLKGENSYTPRSPKMPYKFSPKGTFQVNNSNIPFHMISF
ncbi:uncharacterized protein LOC130894370 [Diorhabda carinulata]|uniref:uncharacterized protein LOC130894370 n=1 Tax=Diorhabda carinulata TaxID=1163345 RepID=UPI0025A02198|nr:uncharacterized protein LOC130894370 [Diorhabda carinulata]